MSALPTELPTHVKLRRDAETRLKAGSAPATNGWSVDVNALSMLHKLASSPTSAIDALKLLHELQVHQIELDLQHEQIETSQRDLVDDLARYRGLYESAPVAYLNVSSQYDILECNSAGASLFGIAQEELCGRALNTLLAPASRPVLLQLLKRLRSDGTSGSCEVQVAAAQGSRRLQILASITPGGASFLVVLVDLTERR